MADTEQNTEKLSYEQAREELGEVVRRLESGGVPLAESMTLWTRGEELAAICQGWLDGAKAKIEAARTAQASTTDAQDYDGQG
ncbi:exodeoxyribonuclease VII small subunit [Luteococcus sanguinis]|uniref:Exodeoxyribonuclease 7 small subunit n=1 Tax=Luteococcus sanguinis TaxID=174038 RepID=A0ABW1X2I5_9ACTN